MATYVQNDYKKMITSWNEFCELQAEIAARRYTRSCFQYWINHQHELDLYQTRNNSERSYVETFIEMFIESFREKFEYEFELHVAKSKQISEDDYCAIVKVPVNSIQPVLPESTITSLSSLTISSSSDDRSNLDSKIDRKSRWSFLQKFGRNIFRKQGAKKETLKLPDFKTDFSKESAAKIIKPDELESSDDNWIDCRLLLTKCDEGYVIELYVPEDSRKPYYRVICHLINELRRTTSLETPNHENSLFIKTDNDFEIFIDVFTSDELQSWLVTIKFCQRPNIDEIDEPTLPTQDFIQFCNNYPWFHGSLNRDIASLYVQSHTNNDYGQFLIRQSNTHKNSLVLTVNYYKRAYHICIRFTETGYCEIKSKWFSSIFDLIDHYRRFPLPIKDTKFPLKLIEYVIRKDFDSDEFKNCADKVFFCKRAIRINNQQLSHILLTERHASSDFN